MDPKELKGIHESVQNVGLDNMTTAAASRKNSDKKEKDAKNEIDVEEPIKFEDNDDSEPLKQVVNSTELEKKIGERSQKLREDYNFF